MAKNYDAIVIGAGHNGLTAAAYLAKAGLEVLVLERRPIIGGATVTEEIIPGFRCSTLSYVVSLMAPEVIHELDLGRHGFHILPTDTMYAPTEAGGYFARWKDPADRREEVKRHSLRDAEALPEFNLMMYNMGYAVKPILDMVPPDPFSPGLDDIRRLNRLWQHLRGLGEKRFYMLLKLLTMSAADFVEEWFETDVIKATNALNGIIGTLLGPRSPGTAYVMLHHFMGATWGFQRGGTGGVADALASAARSHGSEIRCDAAVSDVLMKNGQAMGVALESGEEIAARVVVSGLDPRATFLKLVPSEALPADFVTAIRNFKFRGSSGKVNLALDDLPTFSAMPDPILLHGLIEISPSIDYLERAYDDAKHGDYSRRPYMDIIIPSTIDPTLAPPGKHVMSIFVQYAPYDLKEGTWEEKREPFGDAVVDTLAEFAPNIKDRIVGRQVLSPWDMEQEYGLAEGNIFHGELTLDQLFFLRPVPGWAGYRTPVHNYYQCGSGNHPGGGITSSPGRFAALEVLKDWKR